MAETDENRPPTPEQLAQEQEDMAVQRDDPTESSVPTATASASTVDDVAMDAEDTPPLVAHSELPNPLLVDFPKDNKHRVKLYVLNEQRSWDDKGTGHVACLPIPGPPETLCLTVRSENDHSNVLESKILLDTAYQKQQETLIVWSESDSCDLALSFQEKAGCEEIWEKICQVQGKDPSNDVTQDVAAFEPDNDESDANDSGTSAGSAPFRQAGVLIECKDCEIGCKRD
uniref:PP4R3 EVH1-like domain-containing protein n=1 Tax=Plectus sambesii TaxID=2011161 RepID=A0A914WP43_9BILA